MASRSKIESLLEEFLRGVKVNGEYQEIYVNPTQHEMDGVSVVLRPKTGDNLVDSKEAGAYLRYTAVPSKKLFVFSPYVLHDDVDHVLGVDTYSGDYIHGIARKVNGKWTTVEAHSMDHIVREHKKDEVKKFMNTDWSWMDKYILTAPFIKSYEPKFRRILGETS